MKIFHDSDGKPTQLIKHRLESVASTGSSTSSGFIEDKSYSESDEEEESNRHLLGATITHRVGMWGPFLANTQDYQMFEGKGWVGGVRPLSQQGQTRVEGGGIENHVPSSIIVDNQLRGLVVLSSTCTSISNQK